MEASTAPRPHSLVQSPRLLGLAGDDRLVTLIRAGSEGAFEAVYERYHRPLLSFCRHMLGNPDDAAEAVQQAFLSAYRDLAASDKPIALKAWLFTIARNRCLSILRSRREHADVDVVEPATDGLSAEVQRREDLREMLGDLARLPEDQRAAIVLAELGSLGHDEIAGVLHCPREKVKALVFQARSSLSASRQARDTSCQDIREQLASLRGGALRRTTLRRHLRECDGCRGFSEEVRRQRKAFAAILPVAPVVGLKEAVLSGAGFGGGTAGGAAAGGAIAGAGALGAKSLAVKALVAAAILGGGTAGGVVIADRTGGGSHPASASGVESHVARSAGAEVAAVARHGTVSAQVAVAARRGLHRASARGPASPGPGAHGVTRRASGTEGAGRSTAGRTHRAAPGGGHGAPVSRTPSGNAHGGHAPLPSAPVAPVSPAPQVKSPAPSGGRRSDGSESETDQEDARGHGHRHGGDGGGKE
jgi:RNA polymerase sigma factor (sigma-70 family)